MQCRSCLTVRQLATTVTGNRNAYFAARCRCVSTATDSPTRAADGIGPLTLATRGTLHAMAEPRLTYNDSIRRLQELGTLGPDERPPLPDHLPQPGDDEHLGLRFFRTFLGDDGDLSNLTTLRTFFGRSEIRDTSFLNTDLTESNLRWNDFIKVDFTDAVLSKADLRASIYTGTKFVCDGVVALKESSGERTWRTILDLLFVGRQ